ncbi:transcriptional regulator family: Fungal Specific TF [Aspergillus niger]|uniref:Fungal-specific transcription factor n=1 Tax=Aspergillus phoenicis ATCC 13157 TaxID=1353007 RepID=A0A370P755_ASPPH|nr:transcriptional regulator family: Fungal Specific TF [Aspergillus niger]RDK37527.1 fungal-specific transcription factor [Aspergillus phoenicis ATCC 13157]KAI2908171.1 transcriptional regulator family: Fungal Specific TF [Aspergillus niger]KAI2919050.1 transcriptional regulator family: Fungal Specific TF [Aspergillus niger]KAI2964326.1 transcriptional regulator family: Fungal Specific TF [Aspergillus niger]
MPVSKQQPKRDNKKPIACHRCHAHKVKCSGGQPCSRCRRAGCDDECQYTLRDRKLKVQESYLDELLTQNAQLREQLRSISTPQSSSATTAEGSVPQESYPPVQNPLLGERAWFYPYDPSAPPIYMGDAACTAFATRLRQFLTGDPNTAHVARTQYTPESSLLEGATQWPGLAQARLLVRIAFNQLSRVYHLFLRKSTIEHLESIYRTPYLRDDPAVMCKFFSLFALGEVYSSRANSSPTGRVPGTKYYVRAMGLIPILPERPGVIHVESLLLLSLYSYFLNRRHSAYMLVGSAMRLGLILGLNHNIPERQCTDPIERQHRVRLWWAIYVFDRMYTSKFGFPLQIRDEDIHVDMPTEVASPAAEEQFSDTAYSVASIRLSQIIGQTIDKIYCRKQHAESFLQREQQLLLALQDWLKSLPEHIKLRSEDSPPPKHIVSLHLQFNQCVILATRPILLHALLHHSNHDDSENLPQPVITLSEACIHAARHSHALIIEEWVNGSLPMYGYFYAQYFFSSCIALVISSLLPSIGNTADLESLDTATEILHRMSEHGNLAAAEFYENLKRVKKTLANQPGVVNDSHERRSQTPRHSLASLPAGGPATDPHAIGIVPATGYTTEMAFLEPTMQDFLGRSENEIDAIQPYDLFIDDNATIAAWPATMWTS